MFVNSPRRGRVVQIHYGRGRRVNDKNRVIQQVRDGGHTDARAERVPPPRVHQLGGIPVALEELGNRIAWERRVDRGPSSKVAERGPVEVIGMTVGDIDFPCVAHEINLFFGGVPLQPPAAPVCGPYQPRVSRDQGLVIFEYDHGRVAHRLQSKAHQSSCPPLWAAS